MSSSDSVWLGVFSGLSVVGCIVVFIGAVLEGSELIVKSSERKRFLAWIRKVFGNTRRRGYEACAKFIKPRILPIESLGFAVLITGLGLEFLGSCASDRLQSKRNSELNNQTEVLHNENLVLQAKLQPRTIKMEQMKDFILLTEDVAKIPVRVVIGEEGDDTETFAFQVRDMLDHAKFFAPTNAGAWGVDRDPTRLSVRPIGTDVRDSQVWIICHDTNEIKTVHLPHEFTYGIYRYVVVENHPEKNFNVFSAISDSLNSVGIKCGWNCAPNWVKPGEFQIMIPLKNQ
jgi:hypothetical protein